MPYNFRLTAYLSIFLALSGILLLLPQEIPQVPISNSYPSAVLGSSVSKSWNQTSFTGGVNSGPYTIPWGNSGTWSGYSSQTNMLIDASGIKSSDGNSAELISSVFDQGNYRSSIVAYTGNAGYAPAVYPNLFQSRGANSASGVSSASWVGGYQQCPLPYRYIQYKIALPIPSYPTSTGIDKVSFVANLQIISGFITDSQTKVGINNALIEVDGSKVETSSDSSGKNPGGYSLPIGFITDGTANVKVSAPGYVTVTKTYPMATDSKGCSANITANISLIKSASTNPTVTNSNSTESKLDVKQIALPKYFTQEGSSTTDLSKIDNVSNVSDFTLEVSGKNKIKFKDTVDLSSGDATAILEDLGNYVKAEKEAIVEIDSKKAAFLNKRASIVMYNLSFTGTPKILVDGKINPEVVSNIKYKNKTLSFDVAHFTKFEAVADTKQITATSNYSNNSYLGIGLIILALITFGVGYSFFVKRKVKAKPSI